MRYSRRIPGICSGSWARHSSRGSDRCDAGAAGYANFGPRRLGAHRTRQFACHLRLHSFYANGLLAATMDIAADLALANDGETFDGASGFIRTDISGNALNFCATMSGSRMTL